MKLSLLRYLFLVDAAVLALVGAMLIFAPRQIESVFGFRDLPVAVNYLIGLWGCVLVTLAIGYLAASANPIKHRVWAQVGIFRGLLECVLGLVYMAQGLVSLKQAGFGIAVSAIISIAYLILYPRKPRLVSADGLNPKLASSP